MISRSIIISLVATLLVAPNAERAHSWKPVEGNLLTRWAQEVDPGKPLPDYPRPQMVRAQWKNLNGLWRYAVTEKDAGWPTGYDGQILVPYPIESALSGVKKPLLPRQNLWYDREFTWPALRGGERLLLHFGAVDVETTVFVNGREVGRHVGGYQSFTFDITSAVKAGKNRLMVKVWDPTDQGPNPRGKQVLKPEGIFYTASSGIWQTVWLESVPETYIDSLILTPNVDRSAVEILVRSNAPDDYQVIATSDGVSVTGAPNERLTLKISNPRLWSPADPHLYDLDVRLMKGDRVTDRVTSYFGLRKVEIRKDDQGKPRIFLNGRYTYNLGVLDQGFWPDGLYTAPTDAAIQFDIATIKSMGFNTIRKHIKIEPARWYYYCDKLGLMVWQDMVPPAGHWDDPEPLPEARRQFELEVQDTVAQLHNVPSITTWVLFNEGWGDYDQGRLVQWLKALDPSRLVDGQSGSTMLSKGTGVWPAGPLAIESDFSDLHSYPDPGILESRTGQALALGEHGGISVKTEAHMWIDRDAKDAVYERSSVDGFANRYAAIVASLKELESEGLTASFYTQAFDVEMEQNGLVTYDRKVIKVPVDKMRSIHIHSMLVAP